MRDLLLLVLLVSSGVAQNFDVVTDTKAGKVGGRTVTQFDKRVDEYLGIPFAEPPLGGLRFKHPEPKEKWSHVWNATKQPNSCVQMLDETFPGFAGSEMWNAPTKLDEDCLYLNVWVPETKNDNRKKAVYVWIFGGGFYSGSITLDLYDGKYLAAKTDVIVVAMQYRLSALGFGTLDIPSMPSNTGLFDQLMALDWVNQNIHYFGGDPNNITLVGESAGAASVAFHLGSNLSRSKFQRAIMQSSSSTCHWASLPVSEGKRRTLKFAKQEGCYKKGDDNMEKVADCLRELPVEKFKGGNDWVVGGLANFPFVPVIDGIMIPKDPLESVKAHKFKKTPIIIGFNKDEGAFFFFYEMLGKRNMTKDRLFQPKFNMSYAEFKYWTDDALTYYPYYPYKMDSYGKKAVLNQYTYWQNTSDREKNEKQVEAAHGDFSFVCPVQEYARAYAEAGLNVYLYYFTQRMSTHPWPKWMGVLHGDEIVFTFGGPFKNKNFTDDERKLSEFIMDLWTNYAKTGDPNKFASTGKSMKVWPAYTPHNQTYYELNTKFLKNPTHAVGQAKKAANCGFYNHYLRSLLVGIAKMKKQQSNVEKELRQCKSERNKATTASHRRPVPILPTKDPNGADMFFNDNVKVLIESILLAAMAMLYNG